METNESDREPFAWIGERLKMAENRTPLLVEWVDTGVKPEGLKR